MASLTLPLVVVVALVFYLLTSFLTLPHDAQEPPLIRPKIPLIGHVIGLLHHGTAYYSKTATQYKQPIFTLGVPRGKMYIVTSPSLIAACDRRSKIVSFAPYVVEFGKRILAGSKHSVGLLSEDLLEEKGPHGSLRPETMAAMHRALVPGERLDRMMRETLRSSKEFLDASLEGQTDSVPLFHWVKQFMTIAGTDAVYGAEKNPFRDPEVGQSFWAVDKDFAMLGLMALPDLLASEGNRGRQRFFSAFREYYAKGGLETASYVIKARYDANKKYGIADEDIARFDLGVCIALLVNTAPAVGWTLFYVFSNRTLLNELRQGIEVLVFPQRKPTIATTVSVDILKVTKGMPLLESLVREVLRLESNNASARFILEDIVIDDGAGASYLLKKDSFLGMPSVPVHNDEAIWGHTAHTFDATRFLPERQKERKIPPSAWRTFGGGNALCPGRHLAIRELMTVLVMIALRCDIEPCEENGQWKMPAKRHHISTSILAPLQDIQVRIRPREELRHVTWEFMWGSEKGDEN